MAVQDTVRYIADDGSEHKTRELAIKKNTITKLEFFFRKPESQYGSNYGLSNQEVAIKLWKQFQNIKTVIENQN